MTPATVNFDRHSTPRHVVTVSSSSCWGSKTTNGFFSVTNSPSNSWMPIVRKGVPSRTSKSPSF